MNPMTRLPDAAQLQGPGKLTRLLAFVVVVLVPLAMTSFDPDLGKHARFGGVYASYAAVALLLVPVWLALNWLIGRQQLRLTNDGLQVTSSFYRRSLPLASLQLDRARVLDLAEHRDYRPQRKTNGTALPGLKSGWYTLANGQRTLVAIYNKDKVLWLPTSEGFDLLLQPRRAQALLDHLRSLASTNAQA